MAKHQNELGYGVRLTNPEAFIRAVIKHFFSPINRNVDWQNIVHEARVALFEQDLRLGEAVPETTSGYWWRVASAVGSLLWEDYGMDNMFVRRRRPLSLNEVREDDSGTAAMYLEKQRTEPDPATETEVKEWFEHYLGLAEGVLLDNEDAEQGERDFTVFELWVNGYSPEEIAERPEITWLKSRGSVQASLERVVGKLWEFFGVDRESHVMGLGKKKPRSNRGGTCKSRAQRAQEKNVRGEGQEAQKKRFTRWYADSANRERHRAKMRERSRQRRADAKKAKDGQ